MLAEWIYGFHTTVSTSWIGLRGITRVLSEFTIEEEHLISNDKSVKHASRVRLFLDGGNGSTATMEEMTKFTHGLWQSVNQVIYSRFIEINLGLLAYWKGHLQSGLCNRYITCLKMFHTRCVSTYLAVAQFYRSVKPSLCSTSNLILA